MAQSLGYNDAVLFLSLLYSSVDLQLEWETFSACARPVHYWLLVSYACVLGLRLAQIIGTRSTEALPGGGAAAHFLLQLRHKSATSRLLSRLVWLAAVPFFSCWTVLGTSWLWAARAETPQCMPTATHYWFAVFWLALCYIWISIHVVIGTVAATLEWRVRRAEGDLREIEDADVVSRWGRVSELTSYQDLPGGGGSGLAPWEIRGLPGEAVLAGDEEAEVGSELECSICITCFEPGDKLRCLPGCGHAFHRSCIDLWLLRSADCPLCKRSVRGHGGTAGS
ncbi:unnamed protein product [Prorocentrum cordatum]|uniref:RING-type domain-containing protein n=1 Tax=Prorocentrum cordatum TaxID=2364126 RepID=A0ABN9S618_9DINO|nr:unnamed protein product [Polarella glacialis]|mmetsp:Transcript_3682/g.9771  ORF Transcript_3682/g.9771 Transcript_3682/m.9771 type:complete len:281 (-) Transcript_3682:140-982(-)